MRHLMLIVFLLLTFSGAQAQTGAPDPNLLIDDTLKNEIDKWLTSEVVSLSIKTQNAKYGDLTQSQINSLDEQWKNERKSDDKPLIAATLSSPLSIYLSRMQGQSIGLFVEIFVMDNKGLNVGQSSITSDFWQGDEAKFSKTFPKGASAVFIDEPEWDKDLKIWRVQLNKTLSDRNNEPIGAATIEINLTELQRRNTVMGY